MSTIAAISTAPGIGGIGIIRMSGKDSFKILEKIFKKKSEKKEDIRGYSIRYGDIIDPKTKEKIDEVLVSYFIEPKSYTTENMCEINSHGSIVIMKKILELCLENGAELAEPGEFTKRAFLNGRIDLVQAEAVIDIINSKTEKETRVSVNQLQGYLSKRINKSKNRILEILADIEALIDYPEYDIEEVTSKKIIETFNDVKKELETIKENFDTGRIIKDGISAAIVGKPNVGKSSLLNSLLKEERAIVTEIEGTTRDTIEEFINIEGIPFKIIDTAGIRKAADKVEKIGIDKTKRLIEKADIIIAIFDISKKLEKEDYEIIEKIKNKKTIIVLNKIDIGKNEDAERELRKINKETVEISATETIGIEKLTNIIINMFNLERIQFDGSETIVTNERHKKLINDAIKNIEKGLETIENQFPLDIVAINIKEILENLCCITGENASEDIIKEIFSKFCLGK